LREIVRDDGGGKEWGLGFAVKIKRKGEELLSRREKTRWINLQSGGIR